MRETGPAWFLAVGAHVIADVDMGQGVGMILVQDDSQPIVKLILAEGYGESIFITCKFFDKGHALRELAYVRRVVGV